MLNVNFTSMLSNIGYTDSKFVTDIQKMENFAKLIPESCKQPASIMKEIMESPLLYNNNGLFIGQMSDNILKLSGGGLYLPVENGTLVLIHSSIMEDNRLCAGVLAHELRHAEIFQTETITRLAASIDVKNNFNLYTEIEMECDINAVKRNYYAGLGLCKFLKEKLELVKHIPDAKLHFERRVNNLEKLLDE